MLGEAALEVRAHLRGWDTLIFGTMAPVAGAVAAAERTVTYGPTPTFPFRSRVIPPDRQAEHRRYWLASASHAEDAYLPPEQIFPSLLAEGLQEVGINAVVLNASRAGYDIPGNIAELQRWGEQWQPDYVILYQLSQPLQAIARRIGAGKGGNVPSTVTQSSMTARPFGWADRLVEETTVYANLKGQVTARIGAQRVLANSLGEEGDRAFEALLRAFLEEVRRLGAVPVLTTFATSHTRQQLAEFPEEIALGLFKYSSVLSVEGWVTSVERFNRVTERVASQEGVRLIDVAGRVSGRPEYFRDFVHFAPAGHRVVAETMKEALMRLDASPAWRAARREGEAP